MGRSDREIGGIEFIQVYCPDGYEIELEKSDLSTGKLALVKRAKELTYRDIVDQLIASGEDVFYQGLEGAIKLPKQTYSNDYAHTPVSRSAGQLHVLRALNKLLNVAKYLNGDWRPRTKSVKYHIHVAYKKDNFTKEDTRVLRVSNHNTVRHSTVYFKTQEAAYEAIRILGESEVLNAIYLNQ